MIAIILAFVLSLAFALVGVPLLAKLARKVGLVDHPDDKRKLHTTAIPMVGGIAVFLCVTLVAPLVIFLGIRFQPMFGELANDWFGWLPFGLSQRKIYFHPDDYTELAGLFIGSAILVVVGILDDRFGIRGRQKLLGQIFATSALIVFGYHFESVQVFGVTVNFDVFSILFVYAWVIAAINSVNLLDGADGIAATIGIVMSLALAAMAIYRGQVINAIISIAIAGSLLGFLKFNFPPAKVYLGDTGSMLIGFVLSALAIRCTFKENSTYAFFAPVALLAIPFIDTAAAIVRRRLTGRSIFAVDRGHLHHALMKRGYSPKISLLWVALLSSTTAAGAVLSYYYHQSEYALVSIVIVIIVMFACKIFGVAELRLITRKANSVAKTFFDLTTNSPAEIHQASVHVQGNRDWEETWMQLCNFADRHGLVEITLDLNAPWIHESYHATRKRTDLPRGGNHEWYSQIPLIADGRLFGRVEMIGSGQDEFSHREIINNALRTTSLIEGSLASLVYQVAQPEAATAEFESEPKAETEKSGETASTSSPS